MVTLYEYRRLNFPRLSEMIVVQLVRPPSRQPIRLTAAAAAEWRVVLYGGVTCHGAE